MTTTPLVSIIVPIFNVEPYLAQCLDSLSCQTLKDIEVICIDDGSTDGSPRIMDAIAESDERFHVIHKENGGYGSAVNRGLGQAHGAYIGIVEPDDYVDASMYQKLWDAAKANKMPDIIKAAFWDIIDPDTEQEHLEPAPYFHKVKTVNAPFALADDAEFLFHHPSIWSAIYRRDFLVQNGIKMHEIPGAGWADNPWLIDTLVRATSIVYIDECLYYYRDFSANAPRVVGDPRILRDRWLEMDDTMRNLQVSSPRIWEGHYNRACFHIKALIEGFDQADPVVSSCIKDIAKRVDYSFVCDSTRISEGLKGALHSQVGLLPRLKKRGRNLLGIHHTIN
ncbi:MAG: glycosyltransferase [Atopobiaceae bacterium]|nr:glycosyltransferase [Atopobiaceae bacterium]